MTATETFRDTLYTIGKRGERKWVYPTVVRGAYRKFRILVAVGLMLLYLSLPWLTVGGKQAVLLDIGKRRFTILGTTFWATDSAYLFLVLGILALSLFLFSALFGRVWCGWACPETVFLEFLFRPIESFIEGSAAARRRLDSGKWSVNKSTRKLAKWLVFAVIAWMLASTALAYFFGRESLIRMMTDVPWANPQPFGVTLFLMGLLLFQFGWFREQFCTVLCPYARFQSVLLDSSSLLVGYDTKRGEPRQKFKTPTVLNETNGGDCINCGLCVRVCPTGIDIRNGLQLECIQCTACIDACDSIMDKLKRPRGLIRYDTGTGLIGARTRVLRPRVLIYGAILTLLVSILVLLLKQRSLTELQVLRVANQGTTYSRLPDGRIMNQFKIHFSNKSDQVVKFMIANTKVNSPLVLTLPSQPFPVAPESLATAPLFAAVPESYLKNTGSYSETVVVTGDNGTSTPPQITILGPQN